jgi:HPt (histidine-containing phosphotransfer) domain-containing protein
MDAFISKPFDVNQLLDTIERLVQARAGPVQPAHSASGLLTEDTVDPVQVIAGATWLAMPVFDIDAARCKWRRNDMLMRHLQTFVHEHAEDGTQLLELLHAGRMQELVNMAHKLRGAAGALSLPRCMALATAIEESARSNDSVVQLETWVQGLYFVLRATIRRIEDHLQTHKPAMAAALPVVHGGLSQRHVDAHQQADAGRALLLQLHAEVATNDPGRVERHVPALAQLLPNADLPRLQTLLDSFDFEGVSQWISIVESEIDAETTK